MDENPHIRLSVASVELPNGEHFEQYVFRMRRCVMTVVLDEPGERLLLIWRHRFIVDQWDWEVPGGYVDPGEDGTAAAAREVEEETGWRPRGVEFLLTFQPVIGSADAPQDAGIQAAGQVDRLAAADACLVKLALKGVPDGEQREVERLAANVAGVHVEGSQRVFLGLRAQLKGMEAMGDLGGEIGFVEVAKPCWQVTSGRPG